MSRPSKSQMLKDLHGTSRRDRIRKPLPAARLPRCPPAPTRLSPRARREWRRVARLAFGIGTLTAADLPALALLASTLAVAAELTDIVKAEGTTLKTEKGGAKAHPALRAAETARAQAFALLGAFGLTPASRARLGRPINEDDPSPRPGRDDSDDEEELGQSLEEFIAEGERRRPN